MTVFILFWNRNIYLHTSIGVGMRSILFDSYAVLQRKELGFVDQRMLGVEGSEIKNIARIVRA